MSVASVECWGVYLVSSISVTCSDPYKELQTSNYWKSRPPRAGRYPICMLALPWIFYHSSIYIYIKFLEWCVSRCIFFLWKYPIHVEQLKIVSFTLYEMVSNIIHQKRDNEQYCLSNNIVYFQWYTIKLLHGKDFIFSLFSFYLRFLEQNHLMMVQNVS